MLLDPSWVYPPAPQPLMFILLLVMTASIFLLSGLVFTVPLLLKNKIESKYFLVSSLLVSCTLGYLSFWLYMLNTFLGKLFTVFLYIAIVALIIVLVDKLLKHTIPSKKIKTLKYFTLISLLVLLTSGFYNAIMYSCTTSGKLSKKVQYCSILDNTFDNTLPLSFTLSTYRGVRKASVSDWTTTDRPPLQSGIALLQVPLTSRIGEVVNGYQILAVFLQCMWIFAFFEYIKRATTSHKTVLYMVIIAITSTFVYSNSIFVWPKMLAATLGVFAFIFLADILKSKKIDYHQAVIIATAISLGMLAHGGLIFTVVPLLLGGVWETRRLVKMKHIVIFICTALLLYSPWLIYKSSSSSGDRLINWWISGMVEPDDRPVQKVFIESYSKLTTTEVILKKADNIKALFGVLDYTGPVSTKDSVGRLANLEASFFIPSFSFALIGLFMICRDFILKRTKFKQEMTKFAILKYSLLLGTVCTFLWVFISFGPPNAPTISYAGSYATFLILYFSFLTYLSQHNWIRIVAIISVAYFMYLNIMLFSKSGSILNMSQLFLALIYATLGLTVLLYIQRGLVSERSQANSQV